MARNHIACLTTTVLLPIALAFVVSSRGNAGEYFKVYSNAVHYIAWTEDSSGHLEGQYQEEIVDPRDPTKLDSVNGAFTGIRNGSSISITFAVLFFKETWTGTVSPQSLKLVRPVDGTIREDTYIAGSYDEYQLAAQKLRSGVAFARAVQAYHNLVIGALQTWTSAVNRVNSAIDDVQATIDNPPGTYQQDYTQMQADSATASGSHIHRLMLCRDRQRVGSEYAQVVADADRITNHDEPEREQLMGDLQAKLDSIKPNVTDALNSWPTIDTQSARTVIVSSTGKSLWSNSKFLQWTSDSQASEDRLSLKLGELNGSEEDIEYQAEDIGPKAEKAVEEMQCAMPAPTS